MPLKSILRFCFASLAIIFCHSAVRAQCGSWSVVGLGGFSAGGTSSAHLALDHNDVPYMDYDDGSGATMMKYNGSSWVNVGNTAFSGGQVEYVDIAIDTANIPYASYVDINHGTKVSVMKYSGSSWTYVGSPGFTTPDPEFVRIAFDKNDTPYVAFSDLTNNTATVEKFNGTSWVIVGAGYGYATHTCIAIDGFGTPYVLFADWNNSGKASVIKYNGSSWVAVGSAGFSMADISDESIAIDKYNTPYVSFRDWGNNQKASVMRYNGSNWVYVGNSGISSGAALLTSLAIDGNATPYVAYMDSWIADPCSVQKWNGTSWAYVGPQGFSIQDVENTSMAINKSGVPYVGYSDYNYNLKTTVQKYQQTVTIDLQDSHINICAGTTSASMPYLDTTGGPTHYSIAWTSAATSAGFTNITNATFPANSFSIAVPSTASPNTYTGKLTVSNASCDNGGIEISITVNPIITPSLSVTGSSTVCAGNPSTYTANSNITAATYQWQLNGSNVGTNSSTYSYTPSNSDIVSCITTIPSGCFTSSNPDTSNSITISISPYTTPSLSISGNSAVCSGTLVTYGAASNVPGATYQWKVNGNNVGTNNSTYAYSPANADIVKCITTMPSGCYTADADTSNIIVMAVTANTTPTLSISGSNTICTGLQDTFTATSNVTGVIYQWQVNGINVGSNSNSYTYSAINADIIKCVATMPAGCYTTGADTSNTITMTVNPYISPTIVLSGPGIALQGSSVTISATLVNAGTAHSIEWKNRGTPFNTTTVPSVTYTKATGTDTITAIITVTSPGCYNTDSALGWVVNDSTTGVGTAVFSNQEIIVYPNPFGDRIIVSGLRAGDNVCVYDLLGRKRTITREIQNKQAEQNFSLKELPVGTYFLHVWDEKGNTIGNISLQKL